MSEDDEAEFEQTVQQWQRLRMGWLCPYCGKELPDQNASCCGESGHATYEVIEDGTELRD